MLRRGDIVADLHDDLLLLESVDSADDHIVFVQPIGSRLVMISKAARCNRATSQPEGVCARRGNRRYHLLQRAGQQLGIIKSRHEEPGRRSPSSSQRSDRAPTKWQQRHIDQRIGRQWQFAVLAFGAVQLITNLQAAIGQLISGAQMANAAREAHIFITDIQPRQRASLVEQRLRQDRPALFS